MLRCRHSCKPRTRLRDATVSLSSNEAGRGLASVERERLAFLSAESLRSRITLDAPCSLDANPLNKLEALGCEIGLSLGDAVKERRESFGIFDRLSAALSLVW